MERIIYSPDLGIYILSKIGPLDPSYNIQKSFNDYALAGTKSLRISDFSVSDRFVNGINKYVKSGCINNASVYIDNNTLKNKIRM